MNVWKMRLDMVIGRKTIEKKGGKQDKEKKTTKRGGENFITKLLCIRNKVFEFWFVFLFLFLFFCFKRRRV